MALTISTGFVVDDAIVVIENITRYLEMGMNPYEAAMKGSREIGFTVLSMSTSLIAVFTPILLMGGIVGKLFREFAVTLSVAIAVSLLVSLTTTPMLCAQFLKSRDESRHGPIYRASEGAFHWLHNEYTAGLRWVLRHQSLMLGVAFGTAALNVYLFMIVPKGFFPQQDTGRLGGRTLAAQDISFPAMQAKQNALAQMVLDDPAVPSVTAFVGGAGPGGGSINTSATCWSRSSRSTSVPAASSADQVVARLRSKLTSVPGATLFLQAQQDIQIGGRGSAAQYQYTLSDENLNELNTWAPQLQARMREMPELADVSTDQQNQGLQRTWSLIAIPPRASASPHRTIDSVLYDAFGQREVSTMYTALNQYFVVMEVDPRYQLSPDALNGIFIKASNVAGATTAMPATVAAAATTAAPAQANTPTVAAIASPIAGTAVTAAPASTAPTPSTGGAMVPLSTIAHLSSSALLFRSTTRASIPAVTLTFNLAPNVALGDAVTALEKAQREMGMPPAIHPTFQGTTQAFQDSLKNEPYLILAALVAVYIVLGILYESLIHPLTILSTLPPAGVGAILALLLTGTDLSIIALIGIILLIGIVKKNAIMMIDFALQAEREEGLPPVEAIYQACLLALPPHHDDHDGSSFRRASAGHRHGHRL